MTDQPITRVHELAQLFPMLRDDELVELVESIKRNGQLVPVTIDRSGVLLDGRNRLKACEMAGIPPKFKVYNGDPVEFILASNIDRRHLNACQIALIIALAYPDVKQGSRERTANYSKLEGYSASRLSEARRIVAHSCDLAREVIAGFTPFAQALQYAEHPVEGEHVEPLPDPNDPIIVLGDVFGPISPRRARKMASKFVFPEISMAEQIKRFRIEHWMMEYPPKTIAHRIVLADKIEPGYARQVIDAITRELGGETR